MTSIIPKIPKMPKFWTISLGLAVIGAAIAPSSVLAQGTLFVENDKVGIGIGTPTELLHVANTDGTGQVLIQEQNGTVTRRELFRVENNGDPSFVFQDTSTGRATEFRLFAGADDFVINHLGSGSADLKLDRSGNLTITGSLTQGSSVASKTAVLAVMPVDVLSKVQALPISSWQYRADEPEVRHLGPMAQDFHAAFGLGENDTGIAPADMAGVALAAIQAQQQQIQLQQQKLTEKDGQIAELQLRLAAIEARLSE